MSLDSIKAMNQLRAQTGFHLNYNAYIKRDLTLQFGISLENKIVRRFREDLQFLDIIHPEIGQIFEISHAATKNVRYDYRYRYISVPVMAMYNLTPTKLRNRFEHFAYVGVRAEYLVGSDLLVDLEGFSMRGEGRFVVSDSGLTTQEFNMAIETGYRFVLPIDKSLNISIQPRLSVPLMPSSSAPVRDRIYLLAVNLGINYSL